MSYRPLRKEKICLNCKSVIYGRFCHECGQENTEPRETFWGLITHFVYDLTHFDGKFFATTKYLLFRPGYLALEYLRGRRASYLNPIRMYIFTSAFFFILFFSLIATKEDDVLSDSRKKELIETRAQLQYAISVEKDRSRKTKLQKQLKRVNSQLNYFGQSGVIKVADTDTARIDSSNVIGGNNLPKTVAEYDSIQASLSPSEQHGWLYRMGYRKVISINEKFRGNRKQFWYKVNEKFIRSVPQMMFVSLPLVALLLQLLYIRRKQYYYVNHVVFTVNLYIAVYLLLLLYYGFEGLFAITGIRVFEILSFITFLSVLFYTYKSLRNFYRQRRAKTIIKFLLFIFLFMMLMSLLMLLYLLTSALQI